jgi:hypothetical protein
MAIQQEPAQRVGLLRAMHEVMPSQSSIERACCASMFGNLDGIARMFALLRLLLLIPK